MGPGWSYSPGRVKRTEANSVNNEEVLQDRRQMSRQRLWVLLGRAEGDPGR